MQDKQLFIDSLQYLNLKAEHLSLLDTLMEQGLSQSFILFVINQGNPWSKNELSSADKGNQLISVLKEITVLIRLKNLAQEFFSIENYINEFLRARFEYCYHYLINLSFDKNFLNVTTNGLATLSSVTKLQQILQDFNQSYSKCSTKSIKAYQVYYLLKQTLTQICYLTQNFLPYSTMKEYPNESELSLNKRMIHLELARHPWKNWTKQILAQNFDISPNPNTDKEDTQIDNLKECIHEYIAAELCPTYNNKTVHKDREAYSNLERYEQLAKKAVKLGAGECSEHSFIAAILLVELNNAGLIEFLANLSVELVEYIELDHSFLIINRKSNSKLGDISTWGDNCFIIDSYDSRAGLAKTLPFSGDYWITQDKITRYSLKILATFFIGQGHSPRWINKRQTCGQPSQLSQWPSYFSQKNPERVDYAVLKKINQFIESEIDQNNFAMKMD